MITPTANVHQRPDATAPDAIRRRVPIPPGSELGPLPAASGAVPGGVHKRHRRRGPSEAIATVPDADTRELLYRVSIVTGTFSWDESMPWRLLLHPSLRAREQLRAVLNSWIEQRPDGKCTAFGAVDTSSDKNNLSGPVRRACHVALGDAIIARGRINQHSAS